MAVREDEVCGLPFSLLRIPTLESEGIPFADSNTRSEFEIMTS